ncbi:hypothetical protein H4R33_006301, partial [Dimargaris cristalligena]
MSTIDHHHHHPEGVEIPAGEPVSVTSASKEELAELAQKMATTPTDEAVSFSPMLTATMASLLVSEELSQIVELPAAAATVADEPVAVVETDLQESAATINTHTIPSSDDTPATEATVSLLADEIQ